MALQRFAILDKTNIVIGVCEWDQIKAPDWKPPPETKTQLCDDKVAAADIFDGVKFNKPVQVPDPPALPSFVQLITLLLDNETITQKDIDNIIGV